MSRKKSINPLNNYVLLINDGSGNFQQTSQTLSLYQYTEKMFLEDMDGDGRKDLLCFGSSMQIAFNLGGNFKIPPLNIWVGQAENLRLGDFNKGGRKDMAFIIYDSYFKLYEFKILLQQSGGGFVEIKTDLPGLPVTQDQNTKSIAVTDCDGDGFSDLAVQVVSPSSDIDLYSYRNMGDGSFSLSSINELPPTPDDTLYNLAVGDFDQDGRQDIAGVSSTAYSIYLWGDGTGKYQRQNVFLQMGGISASGDVNGDGIDDLAVTNGNYVTVAPGNRSRAFQQPPLVSPEKSGPLSVADVNGDGFLDLLVTDCSWSAPATIFINDGHGKFMSGVSVSKDALAIADLDLDGKAELIARAQNSVLLWPGAGDPTFPATPIHIALQITPESLKILDLNRDGFPDIVLKGPVASGAGDTCRILYGRGDLVFELSNNVPFSTLWPDLWFGDVNLDGYVDVVGLGITVLGSSLGFDVGFQNNIISKVSSGGDFDGDGFPEIVSWSDIYYDSMLTKDSGQYYRRMTLVPTSYGLSVVKDFNGDGLSDIVLVSGLNGCCFSSTGGDKFLRSCFPTEIEPSYLIEADFDNDSKPDLVLSGKGGTEVIFNGRTESSIFGMNQRKTGSLQRIPIPKFRTKR